LARKEGGLARLDKKAGEGVNRNRIQSITAISTGQSQNARDVKASPAVSGPEQLEVEASKFPTLSRRSEIGGFFRHR
jgi:hypothetical protein